MLTTVNKNATPGFALVRFVAIILFIVLLLGIVPIQVIAANSDTNSSAPVHTTAQAFYDDLAAQLMRHEPEITVTCVNTVAEIASLQSALDVLSNFKVLHKYGNYIWLMAKRKYKLLRGNNTVTLYLYEIKYASTLQEDDWAREEAKHIAGELKLSGLNDFDKTDKIRSYMKTNWNYDKTGINNTAYSLFKTGKGTCLASVLAMQMLLEEAEIESKSVSGAFKSGKVLHVWLLVKLNGWWYSVETIAPTDGKYLYLNDMGLRYDPSREYKEKAFTDSYPMSPLSYKEISKLDGKTRKLFKDGVISAESLVG
jgi:hypothetical protein